MSLIWKADLLSPRGTLPGYKQGETKFTQRTNSSLSLWKPEQHALSKEMQPQVEHSVPRNRSWGRKEGRPWGEDAFPEDNHSEGHLRDRANPRPRQRQIRDWLLARVVLLVGQSNQIHRVSIGLSYPRINYQTRANEDTKIRKNI